VKSNHRHRWVWMIRHNKLSSVTFKKCRDCGERRGHRPFVVFERKVSL
jgi:hypothetical protein